MKKFIFLDHAADIKFRVSGATPVKIFENASIALSHYLSSGSKVKSNLMTEISLKANDKESLLYSFLDELLYLLDAENLLVSKTEVVISGTNLKARVYGDDASKYEINHVKAATYAEMSIKETTKGWEATVVLDV